MILIVFQAPEDSDDSSASDGSSDDDTIVESAEAGPSRKRSRADENDDGGLGQQMERLQLQDTLIKVGFCANSSFSLTLYSCTNISLIPFASRNILL